MKLSRRETGGKIVWSTGDFEVVACYIKEIYVQEHITNVQR